MSVPRLRSLSFQWHTIRTSVLLVCKSQIEILLRSLRASQIETLFKRHLERVIYQIPRRKIGDFDDIGFSSKSRLGGQVHSARSQTNHQLYHWGSFFEFFTEYFSTVAWKYSGGDLKIEPQTKEKWTDLWAQNQFSKFYRSFHWHTY